MRDKEKDMLQISEKLCIILTSPLKKAHMRKVHEETITLKSKTIIKRYFYDYRNEGRIFIYQLEKLDKDEKNVSVIRIPLENGSDLIKRIVANLNE